MSKNVYDELMLEIGRFIKKRIFEADDDRLDYKVVNSDIEAALKVTDKEKSSIGLLEKLAKDKYGTDVFVLCGGLNGPGEWNDYFRDLEKFTTEIKKKYNVWLIRISNDCEDDVFYAQFGISKR